MIIQVKATGSGILVKKNEMLNLVLQISQNKGKNKKA